jgi:EF hand
MTSNIKPVTVSAWLMAIATVAGGCSSSSNPFNSTSGIDRTFIGAAQTWDTDKNGSVSCDEWKQYAATSFRESDTNGDNVLSPEEFQTMSKSDRLFSVADAAYYDANGDGKVTVEELTGKQNRAFALLDKNNDCQIDRNETAQVIQVDKKKEEAPQSADDLKRGGVGR